MPAAAAAASVSSGAHRLCRCLSSLTDNRVVNKAHVELTRPAAPQGGHQGPPGDLPPRTGAPRSRHLCCSLSASRRLALSSGCSRARTEPAAARQVVIYIGDDTSAEELRKGALSSFNVALPRGVEVVALAEAALLAPERYPRFTLVGQTAGSVRLGLAALRRLVPEVRTRQPHALHSHACTVK